ncbi:baseplate J/gp47 family protein [Vallitalea sediminicola]
MKTTDDICKEILNNISDDYEKSTGYLLADLTRSFAIELTKVHEKIDNMIGKIDVDNLKGNELTKYVFQRKGIERNLSTRAKSIVTLITNGAVRINKGDLFSTPNNIQFVSIETKTITNNGKIIVECTEDGIIGMVGANSITKMPITIAGVTNVTNEQASYDGFEEETDQHLRARYYSALREPATSGNKFHYLQWAKEVDGVGNARVFPLWDGDNTVKVVIINSNMLPASLELVNKVQEYIDPLDEITHLPQGKGVGVAPIGAHCTVESAIQKNIVIKIKVTKQSGYSDDEIKTNISNSVKEYLKTIAFTNNNQADYISYAKTGSIILNTEGIIDWTELYINEETANISLLLNEVAVLTEVIML